MTDQELLEWLEQIAREKQHPYTYEQQPQPQQNQDQSGGGMPSYSTYQQIMDFIHPETATPETAAGDSSSGWWTSFKEWLGGLGGESGGSSASTTGEAAGSSSFGTYAAIAAAIAGQLVASNATNTEFEGQKTGNWFTGIDNGEWRPHVATEPWLGYINQQLGFEPSAGEKFDAAVHNKDWGKALKRLPAAADYWADPIRSWLGYETFKGMLHNEEFAGMLDPIGYVTHHIEEWF